MFPWTIRQPYSSRNPRPAVGSQPIECLRCNAPVTGTDDICLVLFCRRPAAGVGKQRLAGTVGREAAAEVARLMLAAAVEDLEDWPGPVALATEKAEDGDWARALLPRACEVVAQPEGNLGMRLNAADRELRDRGMQRLVFIGSDAPELQPDDYRAAREQMESSDVVLGPALDGGVTLMGANAPWPDLEPLPWSTDRLGAALAQLCEDQGRRVAQIEPRADVDVVTDLQRLPESLQDDPRPARQALLRRWEQKGRRLVPAA